MSCGRERKSVIFRLSSSALEVSASALQMAAGVEASPLPFAATLPAEPSPTPTRLPFWGQEAQNIRPQLFAPLGHFLLSELRN